MMTSAVRWVVSGVALALLVGACSLFLENPDLVGSDTGDTGTSIEEPDTGPPPEDDAEVAFDVGPLPDVDSGPGYCATNGDGGLFCDDFETPGVTWSQQQKCANCVLLIGPGEAVSPPNALYLESHTTVANQGNSLLEKVFTLNTATNATFAFSLYIDRFDTVGTLFAQELGLETSGDDRIRARLLIDSTGKTRLQKSISYVDGGVFYNAPGPSVNLVAKKWYRMSLALSGAGGQGSISWIVDGVPLANGIPAYGFHPTKTVAVRAGARYASEPTTAEGWRVRIDDVLITRQ